MTPEQRYNLVLLTYDKDAGVKVASNDEGKRYRRFVAAFGLGNIVNIGKKQDFSFPISTLISDVQVLHELTLENVEFALKTLNEKERNAATEDCLGPLVDMLDLCKDGKWSESGLEDLMVFNTANDRELWIIPKEEV